MMHVYHHLKDFFLVVHFLFLYLKHKSAQNKNRGDAERQMFFSAHRLVVFLLLNAAPMASGPEYDLHRWTKHRLKHELSSERC